MNNRSNRERIKRANQIKAAKAAKSMPAAILLKKKEESDVKALAIVEKLIEPQVDVQWMLDNLQHINRSHLEDVAEERAITKLCGYVLCENPLTKVVNKKYSISALRNKIYDVELMKNYCSFSCYTAMNYIMVQMMTSPLWLRSYEEVPKFKIKEKNVKKDEIIPGVEINIRGILLTDDLLDKKVKSKKVQRELEVNEETDGDDEEELDREEEEEDDDRDEESEKDKEVKDSKDSSVKIEKGIDNLANRLKFVELKDVEVKNNSTEKSNIEKEYNRVVRRERRVPSLFSESLTERLEKNFKELVTGNTIKFLLGEKTEKLNIVKSIKNQERYARMCERLDKLDLDLEEPETSVPIDLRPAPHFEILKEQAGDLVIKVNAFFKGSLEVEMPGPVKENKNEQVETVIPLTDAHAPNALRRRLFLEKLDKEVPELLTKLSYRGGIEYDYTVERINAVKSIVSTFNLTAKNIVFKTAEWTVVSLLMIKLLGFIDELIKSLLSTEHAASEISTLLTSHDLKSDYLDNLIKLLIQAERV